MKKRILLIPLALLLALSLVAIGCPPPVEVVYVVPEPVVITWIAQTNIPAGCPRMPVLHRMVDRIEIATGGRLVIALHPTGGVVPPLEEFIPTHMGILDMAITPPIHWIAHLPYAVPFTTKVAGPTGLEYFFWYMKGDGLDLIQEMIDDAGFNVKAIAPLPLPPEVFLYTTFPIYGVECLEGRKLRLIGDEAAIFGKMGVAAVATPSPEIYEAMALGVLDGFQHAAWAADWGIGLHEVVTHAFVSAARQSTDIHMFIVNKDSWAALPADIKAILESMMWETGIRMYAEMTYLDIIYAQKWVDFGIQVLPIPPCVEEALLRYALEHYAIKEARVPFFARVMTSLREWRDDFYAMFPRL